MLQNSFPIIARVTTTDELIAVWSDAGRAD